MDQTVVTLAHRYARIGDEDGLRRLILGGFSQDCRDEGGLSILDWACRGGNEACILLSLELIETWTVDLWGGNALHHWMECGHEGVVGPLLLKKGIPLLCRDRMGLLPIHYSKKPYAWAWFLDVLWSMGKDKEWKKAGPWEIEHLLTFMNNSIIQEWLVKQGLIPNHKKESRLEKEENEFQHLFSTGWKLKENKINELIKKQDSVFNQFLITGQSNGYE